MAKVALILGAGPNIGDAIAARFAANGYQISLAARSISTGISNKTGFLGIQGDLSDPHVVRSVFRTTIQHFGPPNVVVYNVAHRLLTPPDDPLSATLDDLEASRKAGLDSAFIAAQEALKGFRTFAAGTPTAFIYTGNTLNQIAIPGVLPFALAKTAAAMLMEYAANAYGKDGYKYGLPALNVGPFRRLMVLVRFYYVDQRQPDGRPANLGRDGPAHAEMYLQLAQEPRQSKWLVTFVNGEGRRDFEGVDFDGESRASYDRKFGRA
ncbi:hypothetical protein LTR35_000884 [Friedmanniomyces endolithicus]|uniref:Uncharacterized protein n=1 Tax=Friedmanniomyces endolithicus TaxID=329885 RepID=A0AAN6FSJ4_9PEZI|nr:hypothetical protein LTS00_011232 [Friedmanniomyces endolithicus]KAK0292853.1 hypothetical protein LTR35_000884 [Friedmanniomyces endolithicus]KAK0323364.1 hypothetical protein LTR82_005724 [Friedmanniomyces endolithicus]KAK1013498.1 hypothetical protein LTR54_004405 [Friedmanniomyces endolithicus]